MGACTDINYCQTACRIHAEQEKSDDFLLSQYSYMVIIAIVMHALLPLYFTSFRPDESTILNRVIEQLAEIH